MTCVLELPNSSVSPFGVERATSVAPITPPPPPLFSGTTVPNFGFIRSPQSRPTTSVAPPAESGAPPRRERDDQLDRPFRECGERGEGQGRGRKRGHSVLEKIATIHH